MSCKCCIVDQKNAVPINTLALWPVIVGLLFNVGGEQDAEEEVDLQQFLQQPGTRSHKRGTSPFVFVHWDKIGSSDLNLPVGQMDFFVPGWTAMPDSYIFEIPGSMQNSSSYGAAIGSEVPGVGLFYSVQSTSDPCSWPATQRKGCDHPWFMLLLLVMLCT